MVDFARIRRLKYRLSEYSMLRAFWINTERAFLFSIAAVWRLFLFRTTFIGITGSVGKTTCRECLSLILGRNFSVVRNRYNQNDYTGVPKTLLRVRPWHRYAVVEMGSARAGMMLRAVRLVRPRIGVFLRVVGNHLDSFGSLEDIAREKSELVRSISADGVCVLNEDDRFVRRFAEGCKAERVLFGTRSSTDLQAVDVQGAWPQRLSFTVKEGSASVRIQTGLVGMHWVTSVLGAIAAARACGVSLEECAAALQDMRPFTARLQPVSHPSGAIILRDEVNGSMDSLNTALDVLQMAKAERKILLFGSMSYVPMNSRERFRVVGAMAAKKADGAIFVDKHWGKYGVQAAVEDGMDREKALWCKDLKEASEILKGLLAPGDLLLVKGRGTQHLTRIVYDQFGPIRCWKKECHKTFVCDVCPELKPSRAVVLAD